MTEVILFHHALGVTDGVKALPTGRVTAATR